MFGDVLHRKQALLGRLHICINSYIGINFSVILLGAFQISLTYRQSPSEKTRNFSRTWKDLALQND